MPLAATSRLSVINGRGICAKRQCSSGWATRGARWSATLRVIRGAGSNVYRGCRIGFQDDECLADAIRIHYSFITADLEQFARLGGLEVIRVLVVDDNRDGADTLALLVQTWGYETATAYGGATALELADTFRPDVILLNLAMPV